MQRGEWRVVALNYFGKQLPPAILEQRDFRITIKNGTIRSSAGIGALLPQDATVRINPEAKPRQIEWENGGRKFIGIYELQGDNLKIAVNQATRPADFGETGNNAVYTLKRVKP